MPRLPFNPEPLLAFFTTKENAGSITGDLEERFQNMWYRNGRLRAALWFSWHLFIAVPPMIVAALGRQRTSLLPVDPLIAILGYGAANQAVTIVNFPHEWNRFTFVGIEDGLALLNKWSNHQRFTVPVRSIVPVRSDVQGYHLEWALTCDVRWEPDEKGRGNIWTA